MIGGIAIAAIVVMVTIFICNINMEVLVLCVPACSVICILLFFYSFLVSYLEYVCVGPSAVEDTDISVYELYILYEFNFVINHFVINYVLI